MKILDILVNQKYWIDQKMHTIKVDFRDLCLRFIIGGATVAGCFILLKLIPSKSFAGVFAAFPAIMFASIIMAGHLGNSKQASDIALGASAGMLACTFCVLTASICMEHLKSWSLSIIIALYVWFFSAYAANRLINVFLGKNKGEKAQRQVSEIGNPGEVMEYLTLKKAVRDSLYVKWKKKESP